VNEALAGERVSDNEYRKSEGKMYTHKEKLYFRIAIIYWMISMVCYGLMGFLYKQNISHYNIIYYFLFFMCVLIVMIKDKSVENLGFTKENIKINLLIAFCIVVLTIIISILISQYPLNRLMKGALYYLLYISLMEEIIYRGFIQNYLFGLKLNKCWIFVIGALLFSLMHLPFQMYVNNNVSFEYIIDALPQLAFTCVFHLVMCFITYKRKDITIPVALHFATDYLQAVL
jgi:membrane protease YdiL (CAAX protease family)